MSLGKLGYVHYRYWLIASQRWQEVQATPARYFELGTSYYHLRRHEEMYGLETTLVGYANGQFTTEDSYFYA